MSELKSRGQEIEKSEGVRKSKNESKSRLKLAIGQRLICFYHLNICILLSLSLFLLCISFYVFASCIYIVVGG